MQSERLLSYLQKGIDQLLEQGSFDGGQPFRPTQRQTLEAYKRFLASTSLSTEEKLKGFFEIPTGIGKTAVFVGIVAAAHSIAEAEGQQLKTIIVVPTTQLLNQTHDAFVGTAKTIGFAPHLKDRIGLYGDGHKNLKLPITIMTYNAWYDLSQAGKIGSHNTDILISDEAHRGTSERRIENICGVFNAQTAQIAFTATAHFDDEKSVQASHERGIFYKSIRDAVLEDELASYIQSQRAVIRVAPTQFMLTEEFAEAAKEEKAAYRKKIRQKAWNEFAVKAFKEGRDERTGDPLTDNQAGFFVEGIHQANQLEKILNHDEQLQKIATERGYKGVAVAIHSHLSGKEQQRRFDAYMAGEYMAVVGDEKFKEGFDHPPMKTLFDSAHSSLVDKAQILGRGARKWWNELKNRFEGLTVVDTVIYIGSEDKEEDERLRASALRNAVSAKEILEESFIIGPSAPKGNPPKAGSFGGSGIFDDDDDVEYYDSIEDIYHLENEVSKIRKEHMVQITDELLRNLSEFFRDLKISAGQLLRNCDDIPENLYENKINRWLNGVTKEEDPKLIEYVFDKLKAIKSGQMTIAINPEMSDRRKGKTKTTKGEITEEDLFEIQDLAERAGMSGTAILKYADSNKPKALNRDTIDVWLSGKTTRSEKETFDYVVNLYKTVLQKFLDKGYDPRREKITDEFKKKIIAWNEIVGMGVIARQPDAPEDLKKHTIYCWITGDATTARKYHLDFVLSRWEKLVREKLCADGQDFDLS